MNENNFVIRLYTENDREQIHALVKPLVGVAFNWSPENLDKELKEAKVCLLEEAGEIKSFICLRDLLQAWDLTMVATRQDCQRKGYMEHLMSYVIDKFAVDRQLWLEVHEANLSAQEFYKKLGFQHMGNRGGYYSDGSMALLFTFQNPLLY